MGKAKNGNETLTAREKGDIYWQKLKYYLQSAKDKNNTEVLERKGLGIAKEVFDKCDEDITDEVKKDGLHITGNEFAKRPPTAAGERAYKESITYAVRVCRFLEKYLASGAKDTEDEILIEYIKKIVVVMKQVVNTWFLANGLDYETGKPADESYILAAVERLDKDISTYEESVLGFKRFVARAYIKELKKSFPEMKKKYVSAEDEFSEYILNNAGNYDANKKIIKRAFAELNAIREKTSGFVGEVAALREFLEKENQYKMINPFMTLKDSVNEYFAFIHEQTAAAMWAEDGCIELIKYLLANEKADPMVANYIYAHYGVTVDTYPLYKKIGEFSEYTGFDDIDENIEFVFSNNDEFQKAVKEIIEYTETHLRIFISQSITTMLFESKELPLVVAKSKALRNQIVTNINNGSFDGLSPKEWKDLKNAWITADTITRVAYMVMEYVNNCEKKTMSDLISSFYEDTADFDYAVQEKESTECLEAFLRRRRKE